MRRAYEDLARSMTVVLYDGRGTGASDRRVDLDDLGIEAHLRDLDAVLTAADLDSTSLLGYYHSVATAIAFAATQPERVTRMVLFGGAARMRDAMNPAQTQALLSLVTQDWDLFADSAAQAWLGWGSGETGRLTAAAFRTAAAPATAQAWFTAAASIDVSDVVSQVTAPTLVLHRQGERQISVEVSRRLADALPHGRLIVLPGAFPALFLEDARADLDLVTGFLSTGRTPASGASPGRGCDLGRRSSGRGHHRPRARRASAAGGGRLQCRDRPPARDFRAHRRAARVQPVPQDRRQRAGRRDGLRAAPWPRLMWLD